MKKLIATIILTATLPICFASAAQDNNNDNPDGKPKHKQGGGCHKKDGNNGKPGKKTRPEQDPKNNQ